MIADAGAESFVPGELRLEAPVVDARVVARAETRKHYLQPYSYYAKKFGLDAKDAERALKRWVKRGREVEPPDLPPFDEPHLIAQWWRRHMKWHPPEWALLFEQLGAGELPAQRAVESQVPEVAVEPVREAGRKEDPAPPESLPDGLDLDELPEDAGDAEKELWKLANGFKLQMSEAMKEKEMAKFWPAYNEYKKILKDLRMWEKDRLQKRMVEGKALDVAKMGEVLSTMFGTISKAYLQGMMRLAKKVNPRLTNDEVRALVYPERDEVFRGLKAGRFAGAMPEEVAG